MSKGDGDVVPTESDDIVAAVPINISDDAGIPVIAVPTVMVSEAGMCHGDWAEASVGLTESHLHVLAAEADDVRPTITVDVGHGSRKVFLSRPRVG
ncbi:MAG TPA: hypothetical protein VED21_27830 [Azospirillum sp.]|nr:hypothetical protein [Azospirillum sp.]HYD69316.1 hypothetical protein [Azospirillum sp.]